MPNFDSTTKTAQDAAAAKAGKMIADAKFIGGNLRFFQGVLTVPSGTAIADTFDIIDIPAGHTVIPSLSSVESIAQTASSTLKLGTSTDDDAFSTAIAMDAAGKKNFLGNIGNVPLTARTTIVGTLAGAALTTASVIYFNIVTTVAE